MSVARARACDDGRRCVRLREHDEAMKADQENSFIDGSRFTLSGCLRPILFGRGGSSFIRFICSRRRRRWRLPRHFERAGCLHGRGVQRLVQSNLLFQCRLELLRHTLLEEGWSVIALLFRPAALEGGIATDLELADRRLKRCKRLSQALGDLARVTLRRK